MPMPSPAKPALHVVVNAKALDIWKRHARTHHALPSMRYMPMQRADFAPNPTLLIVGMNPSMAREAPEDSDGPDAAVAPHRGGITRNRHQVFPCSGAT